MASFQPVKDRNNSIGLVSETRGLSPAPVWTANPAPVDGVDVAEMAATLRDRRWLLLGCVLFAILVMGGITLASRMQFKATGGLYLGDLDERGAPAPGASEALDFLGGGRAELGTEIEVIKSESLVSRAILDSGLNITLNRAGAAPLRYARWRLSRRDPALLDTTFRELRARGSVPAESPREELYRATFGDETHYTLSQAGRKLAEGELGKELKAGKLQLTLFAGDESHPRAGSAYDVTIRPLDDVMESVYDGLNVASPRTAPGQTVNVVRLEFSDESPSRARDFLDRLMQRYLEQRQLWRTEKASAVEDFVSSQLKGMRDSLDEAERKLADYKKASGVVVLGEEAKSMIEQIGKFEEQRVAVRLQVSALKDIQKVLEKPGAAPLEAYLMGEAQDTVLSGLGTSLTEAQEELKKLEHQFTSDAPAVREQAAQVDAQRQMVKNYVATRLARAREQLGSIDSVVGQANTKLKTVPHAEFRLAQLVRDSEVISKMYAYLLERKQQAAIVKAATISDNRILDLPKVRYRESSPNLILRLVCGALIGLSLGVLLALSRQRFASTFQNVAEVRKRFPHTPLFSIVPKRLRSRNRAPSHGADGLRLVDDLANKSGSAFREAFRLLRANVYRTGGPGLSRVIVITSLDPGDGKTTVTMALAAALAADGNRVLVVDANNSHGSSRRGAQTASEPGLAEVLAGELDWSDVVRAVPLASGDFFAIGRGRMSSGGGESFSSRRFAEFLAEARTAYSFVLIDAPSMARAADALLMSAYSELSLVVLRIKNSRRSLAHEHLARLSATAECALVINAPDAATSEADHSYTAWVTVPRVPARNREVSGVTALSRSEEAS